MKTYTKDGYSFVCDGCGLVAGQDVDERKAREKAHEVARVQGWKLAHPHWQFYCPSC